MSEAAIVIKNLNKDFKLPHQKSGSIKSVFTNIFSTGRQTYELQHALKNINLEIKKGEFFGIVGRNGSGKSTLLKIIAGIYQPTSGEIKVNGRIVPFIELGVGFNTELSGRENIFLNGALLGFSENEVRQKYDEIVKFAELEKFMDQKLKNYSSGMQVRLAFSVATKLAESEILLVDEVLAVGDTDFQQKCFKYFKELKKTGKTVVFVTHDMNAVREYCDRAILIDGGNKVFQGSPLKIAGEYSKLFIEQESTASGVNFESENRWGNGWAKIIEPLTEINKDKVLVSFKIIVNSNRIPDPIIGFYVVNGAGNQICGTNTQLLEMKLEPLKKGSTYKIDMELSNIFSDGSYSITLALLCNTGSVTIDWWADALKYTINKSQHIPFMVDVPVSFAIKENNEKVLKKS